MVEIANGFLLIVNGYGIELSELCLTGVRMINCEFCRLVDCELRVGQ